MDIKIILELIGYAGSLLVIVSMLMTSVVKLRIINTTGSVIFAIYAFCIKSYPTAAMQICLIIINVVSLYKLLSVKKNYSIIDLNNDDAFYAFFLKTYFLDIKKFFPAPIPLNVNNQVYLVLCNSDPAGIFVAEPSSPESMKVIIDYTTPKYRDGSAGKFLYNHLASLGLKKIQAESSNQAHQTYLKKMGFKQQGEVFVKEL